LNFNTSGCLQ